MAKGTSGGKGGASGAAARSALRGLSGVDRVSSLRAGMAFTPAVVSNPRGAVTAGLGGPGTRPVRAAISVSRFLQRGKLRSSEQEAQAIRIAGRNSTRNIQSSLRTLRAGRDTPANRATISRFDRALRIRQGLGLREIITRIR